MIGKSIKIHKAKIFTFFPKSQHKPTSGFLCQNLRFGQKSNYYFTSEPDYVISFKMRPQFEIEISFFTKHPNFTQIANFLP